MFARLMLAALLLPVLACDPPAATTATSTGPTSAPTASTATASTPTATTPTASAPVAGTASAAPALDSAATTDATSAAAASAAPSGAATSAANSDERLSRDYPGARVTHNAGGRHWHSEGWASKDPPAKVRAYYRRYGAQSGMKLQETTDSLTLDGGGAMGLIRVRAASSDDKLEPGELTVISSSRP